MTSFPCRDFNNMDVQSFRRFPLSLPSWSSPMTDPDTAALQLDIDLRRDADKLAPLRTRARRIGQSRSPWLTPECIAARRSRRRLERQFVRSRSDVDRKAYRCACRATSKLFSDSRSSYFRQRLDDARGDSRQLWRTVKRLLHPGHQRKWYEGLETDQLATEISDFFISKLNLDFAMLSPCRSALHLLRSQSHPCQSSTLSMSRKSSA